MSEHIHKKIIGGNKSASTLISLIERSKTAYIKKNLSIHMHNKELALIEDIKKHIKPKHKAKRIEKYQQLAENPSKKPKNFEIHQKIFLNRYKKLEKKGFIKLDLEPDNGLPYDMEFTQKGLDLLDEIKKLEKDWENAVLKDLDNKEELISLLQNVSLNALDIAYAYEKESKGVY